MVWLSGKARSVTQLIRILRGEAVAAPDWPGILTLANRELVTPRLHRVRHLLPADVAEFVDEVADRCVKRNERLLSQLEFATTALNAAGIVPLVIKGGACLARQGASALRILSDLDVVVPGRRATKALECLTKAGFSTVTQSDYSAAHSIATLERPGDVGQIDLHRRPPGPPAFLDHETDYEGELVSLGAGQLWVPTPERHIYLQTMHDQLHDGAFWHGGFDLRHAWDLADLIETADVNWSKLRKMPPTRHTATAVRAQVASCNLLTGASAPSHYLSASSFLRARAHLWQYQHPRLAPIVTLLMIGSALPSLLHNRRAEQRMRQSMGMPARSSTGLQSLLRLMNARR